LGLLLATVCTLGLVEQAEAAEAADRCQRNMVCRVHSERGVSFSEKKSYAEALIEFQAAYLDCRIYRIYRMSSRRET
jgi:hypothetical protein